MAQPGRDQRRRSLAYFAQLTDFQLADEESPARVEFLDQVAGQEGANSAWRPWEALIPFMIDDSIRQVNRFAAHSPVPQGGSLGGNPMDFALVTGDQADNQQRNEMIWNRALLEGGVTINFNSGVTDPNAYSPANLPDPACQAFVAQEGGQSQAAAEAARYTGVQDYTDYPAGAPPGPDPIFYDPNQPTGDWAAWPQYTGLMDRAQMLSITPAGLDVPSYWVNGNHDVLVQGNEDANEEFENIALGCFKALGTTAVPGSFPGPDALDPNALFFPSAGMLVPPDPLRRFVSKQQLKAVIGANNVDNQHGFAFVDPAENTASSGSASYYAWDPPQTPGVRFVEIDTNSEGGILGPQDPQPTGSSNGNLDDPQFQWLEQKLNKADQDGKLVVIFGHHPVRTMDADVPDEATGPCTGQQHNHGDTPEHDRNPGCDPDPRTSTPLHFGDPQQAQQFGSNAKTFTKLIDEHPNVIAYVAGHTHDHKLLPFTRPSGSVWWEINTSAVADWPHQSRLIDVMDNRDGTLSMFGTVIDHASPATEPAPGDASSFDSFELASIGRTLGFNDPQKRPLPRGEGTINDRNVEMVVGDPRQADLRITKSDAPDPVKLGRRLTYTLQVKNLGPSAATGVSVTDPLPAGVHLISASSTAGSCSLTGTAVNCNLGDLVATQTATVTIDVKMQGTPRTITNTATVAAITDDPNPGNNTASAPTRVVK